VTSTVRFLGQRKSNEIEQRYFGVRRELRSKRAKSAKRHLKKLVWSAATVSQGLRPRSRQTNCRQRGTPRADRGRELDRDPQHALSNAGDASVVGIADGAARGFAALSPTRRRRAGSIAAAVDARHTSQRCSTCGHGHRRTRPTQSPFGAERADMRLTPTSTEPALEIPCQHRQARSWWAVRRPACGGGEMFALPLLTSSNLSVSQVAIVDLCSYRLCSLVRNTAGPEA
jgi:hypothetical protein